VDMLTFLEHHGPALERDEVRHNLILGLLGRLAAAPAPSRDKVRGGELKSAPLVFAVKPGAKAKTERVTHID
jgi:hypothetical protein